MNISILKIRSIYLILAIVSVISFNASSASLKISDDETKIIRFNEDIKTVFISNPEIADYKVLNERQIAISAKKSGRTKIAVNNKDDKTIYSRTIIVDRELYDVKEALKQRFPFSDIRILNRGDQVILYGTVSSEEEKQDIYDLVGTLLNKKVSKVKYKSESDNTITIKVGVDGKASTKILDTNVYEGIINRIEVEFPQQVNVKVRIAEVSSSIANELGVKWSSLLSTGRRGQSGQFVVNHGFSYKDISALVDALNTNNVGSVLAEPNISVMSGETADILVGGEIPMVYQTDETYVVDYKEFGVKLDLAATVKSEDKIVISILTGVTGIDESIASGNYPGFKKRSARSTLQVSDGGSFILGGLISSEDRENLEKIPFIGDVPILGALFRHTSTERVKTELVVIATVNLVKEVDQSNITLPTMQRTSDFSRWLGINFDQKNNESQQLQKVLSDGGFER
ncbi:type II and III secretion system protein family protein [Vibrio hepatarius]|uniref:type II and III secretion system protein family protein n=1 Tax=Vibrio hepatarius TaxID=171383 RepID=UPI001C09217F|nr:pilus assembly protein N-terminal domain-containing protein [Vibrio hepatarius]MBU2896204.1 pilus assembly protein N-terminal domain-containing protein [Vibrio hepatarius]